MRRWAHSIWVVFCLVAVAVPFLARAELGDVVWSLQTNGEIFGSAAVGSDGTAYFGSRDSKVYAVDAEGDEVWVFQAGDWVDSSPTLSEDEGVVYFGSWDNKLYALDTASGSQVWSFAAGSLIVASPAIDEDGNLYFGSSDGIFYSLDPMGVLRWFYIVGSELDCSPAVSEEGHVYVGAYDGKLYSFTGDGELRWTFSARESEEESASRIAGPVSIGENGAIYFGSADGFCYAVSAEGELDWEFDTLEKVDTGVVIGNDGELVVASRSGKVFALDAFGVPLWESFVGDVFFSTPAVDSEGRIYVGSYVGDGVSALNALDRNGDIFWNHLVFDFIDSPPVIDSQGRVLYGCYDGALYALEVGVEPALSSWNRFGSGRANRSLREKVEVPTLTSRFGEWVGERSLTEVFADPCFDGDGDGVALALEYLVAGDPEVFDGPALTPGESFVDGERRLWVEFNRVLGDEELSYYLEYSMDGQAWLNIEVWDEVEQSVVEADVLGDGWYERVRFLMPASVPEELLFRLRMACE